MTKVEKTRVLRIGIVGCGRVANYHARAIKAAANTQLLGVADVNLESAQRLAKAHGVESAYSSLEEMLQVHQFDVLHIVTPPDKHYEYAKTAIEHGISVLIEKPVVFDPQQASDLYDRAAKRGVSVCPDFILMFHPKMQDVNRILESGRLGRVLHVDSHMRLDQAIWNGADLREAMGLHWSYQLPGGLLHNQITHALYMAICFTGRVNNLAVTGKAFGILPQKLDDHLTLFIEGEKCSASVLVSFLPKTAGQDLRIYCEKGTVYVNFDWGVILVESPGSLPRIAYRGLGGYFHAGQLFGQTTSSLWRFVRRKLIPYAGLYLLSSRFYDGIRKGTNPPISRELTLDVAKAEQFIVENAGRFQLDIRTRPSRQTDVKNSERVLVTGASGYVGFCLVKQLVAAGYYVRAMVRHTSRIERLEELGVEIMFGDVRSFPDVRRVAEGMTFIAHVAAAVSGRQRFMVETAVEGTRNIAAAASKEQIKRVIYISSMSVYDFMKLENGELITEESPLEEMPELRGAYTVAKRQAEDIALSHLSDQRPAWTILRPSVIVGQGRDLGAQVGKQVGKNLICLSSPSQNLRLIHVEEVASAIMELLRNKNGEGRVFAISQDPVSLRQFVDTCVRPGQPAGLRAIYVPYFLAWMAAKTFEALKKATGRGPGLNRYQLAYSYRDVGVDSSRIRQQIGWEPKSNILPTLLAESASQRPHASGSHVELLRLQQLMPVKRAVLSEGESADHFAAQQANLSEMTPSDDGRE